MSKQLNTKKNQRVDYDSAWKDVVKDMFYPFLELLFPDVYQDIDQTRKPQFKSRELPRIIKDNKMGKRFADVLVKVFLKDGSVRCLFIHVEVQGTADKLLPKRMYIYNYRIFDRYVETDEEVISLAVFADDDPGFRDNLYEVHRWGFHHTMVYPFVKILDFKERIVELEASMNPMALVVLAQLKSMEIKKADENAKYDAKLDLFKRCFRKGYNKKQIRILIKYFFLQ